MNASGPTDQTPAGEDAVPGAAPQDPQKSLEDLLAEAQAKIEEQHAMHEQQQDALRRALADTDNARKRAQADVAAAGKFAVERFVQDLLPVVDSLEAALAAANAAPQAPGESPADAAERPDPLRSGVELTLRQLNAALEKASVARICPAAPEKFDPNRHQAMAVVESDAEPNTVVSLMQAGYLLHDRVVRPALVTVAKARDPQAGDSGAA